MEMGMDEAVEKPETMGLPKNWSAGMMGMMTMVRVLADKEYDEMQERIQRTEDKPQSQECVRVCRDSLSKNVANGRNEMRKLLVGAMVVTAAGLWSSGFACGQEMPQMPNMPQDQKSAGQTQHAHMQMSGVQASYPGMRKAQEQARAQGKLFTLEEAERLANEANPTLREAEAEIRAARARQQQAGLYPNPTVGYAGDRYAAGRLAGGNRDFSFNKI